MLRYILCFPVLLCGSALICSGQQPVPPNAAFHHVICLVHLVGSGRGGDAIRPDFAPISKIRDRGGILAWTFQLTDDKKMAIVHYVVADRAALAPVLADRRPEIRVFEIGKHSRPVIEQEMKKYKKNFNLDMLALSGY